MCDFRCASNCGRDAGIRGCASICGRDGGVRGCVMSDVQAFVGDQFWLFCLVLIVQSFTFAWSSHYTALPLLGPHSTERTFAWSS